VLSTLDPAYGGPAENARTMSAALIAMGHFCELATLDSPSAPYLKGIGCPVAALGPGHLGKYGFSPAFKNWLRRNVRRFDVIMISGIYQYHSIATRHECLRADIPYIVLPHGALDPWFRHRYPLKHAKKWLYWPWADYRVLRDAARVCFTTVEESMLAPKSFWLYRARSAVIGYGTAAPPAPEVSDEENFLSAYPQLREHRFLLFLSRIDRKKGCQLLIEAFARTAHLDPTLLLVMAGPDTSGWQHELERQAKDLGISSRIVWVGSLHGRQKWAAYRRAEAFVLTSHSENFGIVVVEALACGTPVLISERVNIWHEVVQGGGGLAAPDTVDGATDLLTRWNAITTAERRYMARSAKLTFDTKFDISAVSASIVAEMRRVVSEHRS
jgi:glycosyltransferase involved in cell wall biosynthesis